MNLPESDGLSQELLSQLLRLSHDAIFVWRQGGAIEFWNQGAEELYGYTASEALGRRPVELLASEPLAGRAEIMCSLREARQWTGELRHRCRDGREVTVSSRMQVVRDAQGIELVLESNRDVTEAKRAERARGETEQRLRIALDSSDVSFGIFTAIRDASSRIVDFRWTYVNRANCRLLNRPPEALLGRPVREVLPQGWAPPGLFDAFCRAVETGTPQQLDLEPGPNGITHWFHNVVERFGDGVAVWFTDVSDLKRSEQALRDADRRKDEFLATLAHELRNPLAPIRNGLAILKLAVPMQGTAKRTIEMMERQLTHLVRLIDDLLDVSRITRGKMALRMRRVSIHEVLAGSLESRRGLLDAKRLGFDARIGSEPLEVHGDPDRLMQVFSNLLSNAINYTESGGRITLEAGCEDGHAVVTVSDTGIGIPPGALASVFEMFSQLHAGAQGEAGLGIGLALVRQLVQMHGGSVEAMSEGAGRGSTFIVRLPLIEPADRASRAAQDESLMPGTAASTY
ncbi:MAG TPA: PAS domain-containing sensor histidine kinase [Steroidobacteraceae bacterium]|nr:PAS domain-containing sensor histidine kinase [Steroidobacteraceae bacterium]